ncbi:MauE/DoxX family redox-associated membrane protein [Leeuwenhoekiella sp. NPDC079379]|uniref:MauE/DoxX family redox-associated membrane protein n=1 Tax=Leeuwenhoekiella sp. NPDC079379 TaxID=3364122 RepID=UPI0037CBA09A
MSSLKYSLAALLLVSKTRRLGLLGSAVLMSVFTVYIAGMMLFIPELPCSCGGIINDLTWSQHLLFNLVFTALAIYGSYQYSRFTKITPYKISRAHDDAGAAENL